MRKDRPLILTIERRAQPGGIDSPGRIAPSGIPIATGMRPMTWLEHQAYKIKKLFLHKPEEPLHAPDGPDLNIAVELSIEQYDRLLAKDPTVKRSLEYLQNGSVSMSLVRPSNVYTESAAAEDFES